ncbi:RDD family protein [Candidatus Woesearchaeota archaeon]|nr:RDD family protein [Candidatus Woesearchaeota archaeon]
MVKLNLPKEAMFKGAAPVWKRALAFAIDLLILDFVVGFPLRRVLADAMPQGGFTDSYAYLQAHPGSVSILTTIMIFFGILALLYFALLEYKLGQTIGKIFMQIKVESLIKRMSFFSCLIRSLYFLFVFPFMLLWVIDPLFILLNKEGRRLSELLSRTRTIAVYQLR